MQKVNHIFRFMRTSPSNTMHLVFLYRYITLMITSIFYVMGFSSPIIFKAVVILFLGVAAWIVTDLLKKYAENKSVLKLIVTVETIGITLLLIPTGGISSPFIWYALNPVLVAASFLTPLFCWVLLAFYLSSATAIAYWLFQWESFIQLIQENSSIFLVSILTTLLSRLFSGLTKELDTKATLLSQQHNELINVNQKLTDTNEKYVETLEQIISLYHLMESFANEKSPNNLTTEVTNSLIKCTQSDEAFFWLTNPNHENGFISNRTNNAKIEVCLTEDWKNIRGRGESFAWELNGDLYWMKIIRTSKNVGVLGIKINSYEDVLHQPFDFLAELSEIMLERIHMEQMKDQMLLVEEQNRIANEIHDSVSQRLFGLVFALHSLQVRSNKELEKEFQLLTESANTIIKELRSAIYRLSSVKKDEKPFLVQVKKYLDEYAQLNGIQIIQNITGDEALIDNEIKKALYRIVSEACGNAVRHGKCSSINVKMSLNKENVVLNIQDDGFGINLKEIEKKKDKGIGLINMERLVQSFNGTFTIKGSSGEGTVVFIEIPNVRVYKKQEVAIS